MDFRTQTSGDRQQIITNAREISAGASQNPWYDGMTVWCNGYNGGIWELCGASLLSGTSYNDVIYTGGIVFSSLLSNRTTGQVGLSTHVSYCKASFERVDPERSLHNRGKLARFWDNPFQMCVCVCVQSTFCRANHSPSLGVNKEKICRTCLAIKLLSDYMYLCVFTHIYIYTHIHE